MIPIPANDVLHATYVIMRCARLARFVRWVEGLGVKDPRPPLTSSWWGPIVLNGNVEQLGLSVKDTCPVDIAEAVDTRSCIMALPDHLKDAVITEYFLNGRQSDKAGRLAIEVRAYRRRLQQAHTLLLELFNLSAADLPLEVDYRGPGRPSKAADNG